jgi:biopolymer transport protein TolR
MRRYRIDEKEFSEINITPFTDVILVLLLIFMITSPYLITGALKVKLPKSVNAESTSGRDIEVLLNDRNQIFFNDHQVTLSQLQTEIQVEFLKRNNRDVIIKADKNSLHGYFVQLVDVLKSAGASKFLIATSNEP